MSASNHLGRGLTLQVRRVGALPCGRFEGGASMTGDERRELQAAIADLEAEEADQQATYGYAPPRPSRAIARLHQLTSPHAASEHDGDMSQLN
jgi:hypothetical protein